MTLVEQLKEASEKMWLIEEEIKLKEIELKKATREVSIILIQLDDQNTPD